VQIALDLKLKRADFERTIDQMIADCQRDGLALTIPVKMGTEMNAIAVVASYLPYFHCDRCDAKCCKFGKNNYIALTQQDYLRLMVIDYDKHVQFRGNEMILPYPCPYLVNNQCSIYANRPSVCITYPMQPTNEGYVAIQPDCPQAPAVVKAIYVNIWQIINNQVR
jgi:Fe-S-cluster containining protein